MIRPKICMSRAGHSHCLLLFVAVWSLFGVRCAAIEVVSAPTIQPAPTLGMLTRMLHVQTDIPTRPSLRVVGSGEAWTVESSLLQTTHEIPLLGFTFDSDYTIDQLQFTDVNGMTMSIQDTLAVTTEPARPNVPLINVNTSIPAQMEPGYILFPAGGGHTLAVDAHGVPRWHYFGQMSDIHQTTNGRLLGRANDSIREIDLLGRNLRVWHATGEIPEQLLSNSVPVEANDFHHDVVLIAENNNVLTLERTRHTVDDFPISETDPNETGTVEIISDAIIEIADDGTVINRWDLVDMLDPQRGGYGLFRGNQTVADWSHSNAVFHDPTDDSIIVSVRNQDAVIKFSRETGELQWILGPHEGWGTEFEQYLLTPVGDDFEWPYHTHAPEVMPNGNIMLHDNGNFRARPFDPAVPNEENYTRGAVEYAVDEDTMEVTQVWEYGKDGEEVLYTPIVGDADWQPTTDNVLMTFGSPRFINGEAQDPVIPRIIEVDRDGNIVFDLGLVEPNAERLVVYRADRIPSLYGPEYTMTLLDLILTPGDFNGSGQVEQGDLDLVLLFWGQDGTTPPDGWVHDLPTGSIDQDELDLVLLNWGETSSFGAISLSTPEPATWTIVLLIVLIAMAARCRKGA